MSEKKEKGLVRPIDKMGRVVIPKEMRKLLKVENCYDSFEIFCDGDKVVLKKYSETCIFCDSTMALIEYGDHFICHECIDKLSALKENDEAAKSAENI